MEQRCFGMLDTSIEDKKAVIDTLDNMDNTFGLEEEEIILTKSAFGRIIEETNLERVPTITKGQEQVVTRGGCQFKFLPRLD